MKNKSLGAFKNTIQYHSERYHGIKSGYLQAHIVQYFDWSIEFDVGSPKALSSRGYAKNYISSFRKAILSALLEENRKSISFLGFKFKTKSDKIRNLHRQLIAIRLFRERKDKIVETAKIEENNKGVHNEV